MLRRSRTHLTLSLLLLCVPTFGNDATRKAVDSVPSDAMAFLCIPHLATLDADVQQLVKDLELTAFVPPPMQSLVAALKMNLPMLADLDETGPICVVVMPFTVPAEIQSKVALILPAAQPKTMITTLGGQTEEGGVWPINFMGQSQFAVAKEKAVILAQTKEVALAIAQSKSHLTTKLNPDELKVMADLDIILWISTQQATKVFKPQIDAMLAMFAMMQAQQGGPLAQQQADMTKSQVDMFVLGIKSITIGISLNKAGLAFRAAMSVNPGTELASQMKLADTKDALLTGLPLGKYILAVGQKIHPDQAKAAMKQIDMYFDMAGEVEGVSKENMTELKGIFTNILSDITSYAMTIEALPPGDQGLIGLTQVMETTDAAKVVSHSNRMIAIGMEALAALMKNADEDLPALNDFVIHAPKAESGPAGPVAQVRVDFTKIDEIDDEDLEEMLKVIGKEGLVIRMAAADAKHVVVTVGGGKAYFDRAIATAKSNQTPMANDVGIKKVATHQPVSRASVLYLALDHGMELVNNIKTIVHGQPLPMPVPTVNAPIALTTSGGDSWTRFDLFFPTDLLIAAKNIGMGIAMGGAAPPPEPAAQPGS